MEPESVQLTLHPDTTAELIVGGHDLSRAVRNVQIGTGETGELHSALVRLGWRPPE